MAKIRVHNPAKKKKKAVKKRKRKVIHKRIAKKPKQNTGVKKMAKKRRKRRVHAKPVHHAKKHYRRRHYRKNPGGVKIIDMLINSALAGGGMLGTLMLTKAVEKFTGTMTPQNKNFVKLGIAMLAGWILQTYVGGDKAKAITYGAVGSVIASMADTALGLKMLAGEDKDEVQKLIDNIDLMGIAEVDGTDPDLFGIAEMDGNDELFEDYDL